MHHAVKHETCTYKFPLLQEIPFEEVESDQEFSCPFSFDKVEEEDCYFYFKVTQKRTIELRVPHKVCK